MSGGGKIEVEICALGTPHYFSRNCMESSLGRCITEVLDRSEMVHLF